MPAVAPAAVAAPTPAATTDSIEQAAKAAVAAALLPTEVEDVTIRPIQPKPSLFPEPAAAEEPAVAEAPPPQTFIPPAAERAPVRPARMPRIDELPLPAQNEIRARRGETPEPEHPERRRMSLLQRLASVGLGRREEEEEEAPAAKPQPLAQQPLAQQPQPPAQQPQPMPARPPLRPAPMAADRPPLPPRPMPRHPEPRGPEPVSEFARRPAPQGLDPHGRQAPVHYQGEDDQLDIPAFLRRQAK
jgi:cell division protein FtsZ